MPTDKKTPATPAQLRFLEGLTSPERLARLSTAEARFLITWLKDPPRNMSGDSQVYIYGLIDALSRDQVRALSNTLRGMTAPPSPPPTDAPL